MMPYPHSQRFLSLYLSNLSIERVYRDTAELADFPLATLPLVLYTKRHNQLEVVRVSEEARHSGLSEGVSLTVAKTLCPDLVSYPYDPTAEFLLIQKIALWCLTFSPVVGIDDDYVTNYLHKVIGSPLSSGIIIDLSGTERVHKGEERIATSLVSTFAKRGLSARIAISNTIGRAWAHARFSPHPVFIDNRGLSNDDTIATYPIEGLRLPSPLIEQIADLGIRSIGQLLSMPRKSLLKRFGRIFIERIEQLEGERFEFIRVISAPPPLSQKKSFELPSNSSFEIASSCEEIYRSLCATLAQERRIPRAITVSLAAYPKHQIIWQRDIFLFRRTPPAEFRELLLSYLEGNRAIKDVCVIKLSIVETETDSPAQLHFDGSISSEGDEAIAGLLGTLSNKMGRGAIHTARLYDAHLPEESIGFAPIGSTNLRSPPADYAFDDAHEFIPIRPSLFFHPGHTIRVLALLPDHPPKRMYLGREQLTVVKSIGPEKIEEPWFAEADPSLRDYFRVQDSHGRWLWVCHHRADQRWTLCGIWM